MAVAELRIRCDESLDNASCCEMNDATTSSVYKKRHRKDGCEQGTVCTDDTDDGMLHESTCEASRRGNIGEGS